MTIFFTDILPLRNIFASFDLIKREYNDWN